MSASWTWYAGIWLCATPTTKPSVSFASTPATTVDAEIAGWMSGSRTCRFGDVVATWTVEVESVASTARLSPEFASSSTKNSAERRMERPTEGLPFVLVSVQGPIVTSVVLAVTASAKLELFLLGPHNTSMSGSTVRL